MQKKEIGKWINRIENILLLLAGIILVYFFFFYHQADGKRIQPYDKEEDYPIFSGKQVNEYWRTTLNEEEQAVYDDIKEGYLQFRNAISPRIESLSTSRLKWIYCAVYQDHPEIFWMDSYNFTNKFLKNDQVDTGKTINLYYTYTKEEAVSVNEKMKQNYEPIIEEAQKQESDLDKIRFVHDTLVELGSYQKYTPEQRNEYQSIVSLFRDRESVCAGYSLGFKMIMDRLDIESTVARDISNEEVSKNHIWNLVKQDGIWYNIDITWDQDNAIHEKDVYAYFMLTHEKFYKTHKKPEGLPENQD